jgi:TolB-like protein/Tfp pilus assembly protein PilF
VTNRQGFLAELNRRNVLRAALLYAGAVWALAQGIAQLAPLFGDYDWIARWFVVAGIVGFPFWVAFAWFYEFTPQGFKRESEVPADAPARDANARKLNVAIFGVMALAIVLLASGYFIRRQTPAKPGPVAAAGVKPAAFAPPKGSLVVLPFKNLSGDPKQQYFSDGITEELTGALGQNPGLRVIAWDTASTLRDTHKTATDIGKQLNVANLLHGSILRNGDDVRISAELVNTTTGYELWSAHYDGAFKDIFKVQDQVSTAIANALQIRFAQADLPKGGTTNPAAHELVLKGRALGEKFNVASVQAARQDFEQAVALDPNYADAHAHLSGALLELTERSDLPLETTLPRIRAEAKKALALDPHSAEAWIALGLADESADSPDLAKARSAFRKALALDPSNAGAHLDYGTLLPIKAALAEQQEATLLDPVNGHAWNNLAVVAQDLRNWPLAIRASLQLIKLDPSEVDSAFYLAFAYQQSGQYDKMAAAFDLVQPTTPLDRAQVEAGRLTYKALRDPALRPQALAAVKALAQHQSNQDVAGNLLQMYLALGETEPALAVMERSCPADPIACTDLAVNPVYTPLHGHPRFEALAKKYTAVTVQ